MKFFLTTAIDFVNSRPHLGTAYEKITADVIARYSRLAGFDTWFLMGNDEHSQNVFRRAQEVGKDPLAYCDEMERVFTDVWRRRTLSDSSDDQTGLDSREELVLPAVEVPKAAAGSLRGQPVIHRARSQAKRNPSPGRSGPRRHLGQPGRTVVGHPHALRPR